ncbi:MAG: hypothetical protein VX871_04330 [Pseudomonadota bacterium]|nr:hypothetical protein [Pseudomonadota bacterium]
MRLFLPFITLGVAAALLAGCNNLADGPPESRLANYGAAPPSEHAVTVCHAYGCQRKTKVVFNGADVAAISALMQKTKKADTPEEERRAVAYAVGWMETKSGEIIGTKSDRPGMDFRASGDPSQQDCVDEAMTTTGYLMFLYQRGLIKHHTVGGPVQKGKMLRGALEGNPVKYWPHWTAILKENSNGQRWAVDSWIYENGENPAVVKVEEWYIDDLNNLPKPAT